MIGIVLVSHSETLAKGVLELIQQMVQDQVPIALGAGTDNEDEPIGTDPMKVLAAIHSVYSDDGVLVLMDLGSALMSAETAIELLELEQQEKIYLCEVPLVEGGLAAAVAAGGGGSIEFVINEARDALIDKSAQLEPMLKIPPRSLAPADNAATHSAQDAADAEITVTLPNALGLHARPAARVVSTLAPFASDVAIRFGSKTINARSLNKIVTLGSRQGDELVFQATGTDAEEALAAIEQLATENFGDNPASGSFSPTGDGSVAATRSNVGKSRPSSSAKTFEERESAQEESAGVPTSEGIAVGPVVRLDQQVPTFVEGPASGLSVERARLNDALTSVQADLIRLQQQMESSVGGDEAAIFEAQRLMLEDPDLMEQADTLFDELGLNAEATWQRSIQATVESYLALDDAYLRGRAVDLEDAGRRVLRHLCGQEEVALVLDQPSIIVAEDLHPSDTAELPMDQVLGLLLERGGATSHSAILARALGIPAVVGIGPILQTVTDGQTVGLDGSSGRLWLSPTDPEVTQLHEQRQAWLDERQRLLKNASEPTFTQDGKRIEVAANIGSLVDAKGAVAFGAEGVGLFRTEFLFMERTEAPTEAEQIAAYQGVAQALDGAPVIIRTLDIGGDKPIPYLNQLPEENPFLGWRGIRFCLGNPDLFKTQLRALLQAGADQSIKIMLPMVSTVEEVRQTKALMGEARAELTAEGKSFNPDQELGIMIETPAAVLNAAQLASEVDFFSIGTNDLTQYVMAADRGNAQVAELISPFQPAVLRAIHAVVEAAHEANLWIGMCGEMAGNPVATPLLVGLGIDELSMSAGAIPKVKQVLRSLTIEAASQVAQNALTFDSAISIRDYMSSTSS